MCVYCNSQVMFHSTHDFLLTTFMILFCQVLLNETIKKRHEGLALYMKDAWDREHALRSLLDIKLERFAEYQALKGAGLANVARSLGAQS